MTTADEALRQAQEQADRDAALEDQQVLAEAAAQGDRIGELERKIDQLQHSHVDGALIERMYISDGAGGVRGVVGGTSGIVVRDTNQPTPTTPILEDQNPMGIIEVRWDGEVTSDQPIPRGSGFGRVQTRHRLIEGGVQPDPDGPDWKEGGAIGTYTGGTTTVALAEPGTHAIWFYMVGPNNVNVSEFSQPLIVEVDEFVDTSEIEQELNEAREALALAIQQFNEGQENLDGKITHLEEEVIPTLERDLANAQEAINEDFAAFRARQANFEQSISGIDDRLDDVDIEIQEALEGPVDHERLRVGTGAFNEAFVEKLMVENAEIINAAMRTLTVTEMANFVDAFAEALYADEFYARVASMARGYVAAPNPIPAVSEEVELPSALRFFEPAELSQGRFGFNTGHPSVWIQGRTTNYTNGTVRLEAEQEYEFAVEVAGSVPGTRFYIDLTRPGWRSGDPFTRVATNELAGTTSNWAEHRQVFTVPETGEYRIKIWANHNTANPPGASNPDGYQWFRGMAIRNRLDGTLIVERSIKTAQLDVLNIFGSTAVIDEIWSKSVRAKLLEAEEAIIGGALLRENSITVNKLTGLDEILTESLRALMIEAGEISANAIGGMIITGAELVGGVVRGGYLQIGDRFTGGPTNMGAEITQSGIFRHRDQSGNVDVEINGSNNRFGGRFTTTGSGGSVVEIDTNFGGMAGIRFNTGSSADSEPTLLASSNDAFYGEGSITLSGRQTVMNQSNRADLTLWPNGNWALRRGHGDGAGIGVQQDGWNLRIRGRFVEHSTNQVIYRDSDSVPVGSNAMMGISFLFTPPPNRHRYGIMSPKRLNTNSPATAQSGITKETASGIDAWIAFPSGGTQWRINLLAWWM